jgi:hypothetical protein
MIKTVPNNSYQQRVGETIFEIDFIFSSTYSALYYYYLSFSSSSGLNSGSSFSLN